MTLRLNCESNTSQILLGAGETIPLSDSDEEMDSDTESLDGVSREADMDLLKTAFRLYGNRFDVVRIAAGILKVKKGAAFRCFVNWPRGRALACLTCGCSFCMLADGHTDTKL